MRDVVDRASGGASPALCGVATAMLLAGAFGCADIEVEAGGACAAGERRVCYDGPALTQGVGPCVAGAQVCDGHAFGACVAQHLPGAERCDTPDVDESCDGVPTCEGHVAAALVYGSPKGDYGSLVEATDDGGVIVDVAFTSATPLDIDGTSLDPWSPGGTVIARLDRDAHLVWARPFGAEKGSTSITLARAGASGTTRLVGSFEGGTDVGRGPVEGNGLLFLTLAENGNLLEDRVVPLTGTLPRPLAVNADGRVAFEQRSTPFGETPTTSLFLRTADEPLLWARSLSASAVQIATALFEPDGSVLVLGAFRGALDVAGTTLSSGDSVSPGQHDVFLLRFSPDGEPLLARSFPAKGDQLPTGLVRLPDGDFVIAALADGTADFGGGSLPATFTLAMARFSAGGDLRWQRVYDAYASFQGLSADGAGNLALTVVHQGPMDFGNTVFWPSFSSTDTFMLAAKLDGRGDLLWGRSASWAAIPSADVAAAPTGDLWVSGPLLAPVFWSGLEVKPLFGAEQGDLLVTRFTP